MKTLRLLSGICVLVLAGCASPDRTASEIADSDRLPAADPQFPMAKLFDDLLQKRLNSEQREQFQANCKELPDASVFCFAVLNRERFEQKAKELEAQFLPQRYRGKTYRAHFTRKNEIRNWKELRAAPVQGILRGLPKGYRKQMQALKIEALRETECPNNVAIALAAALEDKLPKRATFDELGRLYEKGGKCLAQTPADQEQVLTRAGLLYLAAGDTEHAKPVLQESSETNAFTGRALYWLYRLQLQAEEKSAARSTLEKLQNKYPFSFHSLVAQTAAGKDPGDLLSKSKSPTAKRSQQDPEVNQLLEAVEILHRLGFEASASTVLNWTIAISRGAIEPEVLLYLAELKDEQGDSKSKIAILSDVLYQNPDLISRGTLERYFPKVLFPIFEKHQAQIDPYFLLAVARRESAFDPNAVSSADARGLLQILPKTGRRWKKRANLFDPETNVAVGTKYILDLLKRTDGQVHLALAAYNAGPGRLKTWTRCYPTQDPILFTDLIPFKETREYVGSVLRNYYWYRRIHNSTQPIPAEKILELAIANKEE